MIATLIRGNTMPTSGKYRDEYLVYTETNEIIYPYTKSDNILGLTCSGGIMGGIDPSTYITETKSIVGISVSNQKTTQLPVFDYTIESDGIYLVVGTLYAREINRTCTITSHNVLSSFSITDIGVTKFPVVPGKYIYADMPQVIGLRELSRGFKFEPWIYLQYNEVCVIREGFVQLDLIKLCDLSK